MDGWMDGWMDAIINVRDCKGFVASIVVVSRL